MSKTFSSLFKKESQKTVQSRNPTEASPVKKKIFYYVGIRYQLDGERDWGSFEKGETSFTSEITNYKYPISAFSDESAIVAAKYFSDMKKMSIACPRFFPKVHFFDKDNNNVVMEKLGIRLGDYQFTNMEDYKSIFRSAMLGLYYLEQDDKYCGNVPDISVTLIKDKITSEEKPQCKFTCFGTQASVLKLEIKEDFTMLRYCMVFPFIGEGAGGDEELTLLKNNPEVPITLYSYFETTSQEEWTRWYACWKLDDPCVWNPEDKYNFFKKLGNIYDRNKGRDNYELVYYYLPTRIQEYQDTIRSYGSGRLKGILKTSEEELDKLIAVNEGLANRGFFKKYSGHLWFFRFCRFGRASVDHYNKYAKNYDKNIRGSSKYKDVGDVAEELDVLLHGACHYVRKGLWRHWSSAQGKVTLAGEDDLTWVDDMKYLLSWEPA